MTFSDHVVYKPVKMMPETLEVGYWQAYREFYRWNNIFRGAWAKEDWGDRMRHLVYAGAWKKLQPAWDLAIRTKQVTQLLPALEKVLTSFGTHPAPQKSVLALDSSRAV